MNTENRICSSETESGRRPCGEKKTQVANENYDKGARPKKAMTGG
jgi:hypothetical protein